MGVVGLVRQDLLANREQLRVPALALVNLRQARQCGKIAGVKFRNALAEADIIALILGISISLIQFRPGPVAVGM
jgi:hypothetical protein